MDFELIALTPDDRALIRELLFEYRRHIAPTNLAEKKRVRRLLNKVSELQAVE